MPVSGSGGGSPAGARIARGDWPGPALAGLALGVLLLFAWNVASTWFLTDDAFISFRYARNLVDGLGPVWNAGERVEGYTNFSWVLLTAAGMALGFAPELWANGISVACGLALLVAALRFAARGRSLSSPWPWLLVGLLALDRSFTAWCTGGLETMLFALLVFLGVTRVLAPWDRPVRDAVLCSLCFAAAALTRPEGLLFAGLGFGLLTLDLLRGRRTPATLAAWLAPLVLVVGAHLLWRHAYYGEWVPNTFYAKVPGLGLEQGSRYYAFFHDSYRIGWFLPLAIPACFGRRSFEARSVAFVLAVYGIYVLAVGGDWFELRFFVHVLPLLLWVLVEGLAALVALAPARGRSAARVGTAAVAVALAACTWLGFGRLGGKPYGLQTVQGLEAYARRRMDEGRQLRAWIEEGRLPRDLVLCMGGAGAVPYYTGWTTVDRRGLSDAHVARLPIDPERFVGHQHDAPWEYLEERRVAVFDYFNQLLFRTRRLDRLVGPYRHEGRPLRMRAIPLGERALVFGTFVDDEELARLFPGAEILVVGDG